MGAMPRAHRVRRRTPLRTPLMRVSRRRAAHAVHARGGRGVRAADGDQPALGRLDRRRSRDEPRRRTGRLGHGPGPDPDVRFGADTSHGRGDHPPCKASALDSASFVPIRVIRGPSSFQPFTFHTPPSAIASRAFVARLISTVSSCPLSAISRGSAVSSSTRRVTEPPSV